MNKNKLKKYLNRSQEILSQNSQVDEANTKTKIIQPLIKLLGWDIYSDEVELEYSVQMGRNRKKVDYALILEENPLIFIEAKGAGNEVKEGDVNQLKSYMRQEDVSFGLISNGKEFRILKMKWAEERVDVEELSKFKLNKIVDKLEVFKILSKEASESGKSKRIAKKIEETRRNLEKIRDKKNKLTEKVVQVIGKEIEEINLNKVEEASAKFIEDLISTLKKPAEEKVKEQAEEIETISRKELKNLEDGRIVVCPSKPDGINFLSEYNAWGFININRRPKYLVIYVTRPESKVKYFAEIKKIITPESSRSPVKNYEAYEQYEEGKKILMLKKNSLKKLKEPVPLGERVPYGLQYSTLDKLKTARSTDDIL